MTHAVYLVDLVTILFLFYSILCRVFLLYVKDRPDLHPRPWWGRLVLLRSEKVFGHFVPPSPKVEKKRKINVLFIPCDVFA